MIHGSFETLCKVAGRKCNKALDVGAWNIDSCTIGRGERGYVIEEVSGKSGGVFHPFGDYRRSGQEMYYFICSLIRWFEKQ